MICFYKNKWTYAYICARSSAYKARWSPSLVVGDSLKVKRWKLWLSNSVTFLLACFCFKNERKWKLINWFLQKHYYWNDYEIKQSSSTIIADQYMFSLILSGDEMHLTGKWQTLVREKEKQKRHCLYVWSYRYMSGSKRTARGVILLLLSPAFDLLPKKLLSLWWMSIWFFMLQSACGKKSLLWTPLYCILLGPLVAILKKPKVLVKEKTSVRTWWLLNCPYV